MRMSTATVDAAGVRRRLGISISEVGIHAFNAFDPELQGLAWQMREDLQRMMFMCLERGSAWGVDAHLKQEEGSLILEMLPHCFRFDEEGITLCDGSFFTANYYGQLQLHQWLEAATS